MYYNSRRVYTDLREVQRRNTEVVFGVGFVSSGDNTILRGAILASGAELSKIKFGEGRRRSPGDLGGSVNGLATSVSSRLTVGLQSGCNCRFTVGLGTKSLGHGCRVRLLWHWRDRYIEDENVPKDSSHKANPPPLLNVFLFCTRRESLHLVL